VSVKKTPPPPQRIERESLRAKRGLMLLLLLLLLLFSRVGRYSNMKGCCAAEESVWTSGPQTTARGPNPARLPMWPRPLNRTRDAFRVIIVVTWPAAVEIAVRRGENVEWCSSSQ